MSLCADCARYDTLVGTGCRRIGTEGKLEVLGWHGSCLARRMPADDWTGTLADGLEPIPRAVLRDDDVFDRALPRCVRERSAQYWTPVAVAP